MDTKTSKKPVYECSRCGKVYESREARRRHMSRSKICNAVKGIKPPLDPIHLVNKLGSRIVRSD